MKRLLTVSLLLAALGSASAQIGSGKSEMPPDAVVPPPAEFVVCPQETAAPGAPCTTVGLAVCGAIDNGIRCVAAPCDNTDWQSFDDACTACATPGAVGYREGAC